MVALPIECASFGKIHSKVVTKTHKYTSECERRTDGRFVVASPDHTSAAHMPQDGLTRKDPGGRPRFGAHRQESGRPHQPERFRSAAATPGFRSIPVCTDERPTSHTRRAALRKCLRCGSKFASTHAGHRICDPCRLADDWVIGGYLESPALAAIDPPSEPDAARVTPLHTVGGRPDAVTWETDDDDAFFETFDTSIEPRDRAG